MELGLCRTGSLCAKAKAQIPRKPGRRKYLLWVQPSLSSLSSPARQHLQQGRCWFPMEQELGWSESEGQLHLRY